MRDDDNPNRRIDSATVSTAASLSRGLRSYGFTSANGRMTIFIDQASMP